MKLPPTGVKNEKAPPVAAKSRKATWLPSASSRRTVPAAPGPDAKDTVPLISVWRTRAKSTPVTSVPKTTVTAVSAVR